jgi:hypothetical protein
MPTSPFTLTRPILGILCHIQLSSLVLKCFQKLCLTLERHCKVWLMEFLLKNALLALASRQNLQQTLYYNMFTLCRLMVSKQKFSCPHHHKATIGKQGRETCKAYLMKCWRTFKVVKICKIYWYCAARVFKQAKRSGAQINARQAYFCSVR